METGKDFENTAKDAKGKVKEAIGDATGNEQLAARGRGEQVAARMKRAADEVVDAAKRAAGDIKDRAEEAVGRTARKADEESGAKTPDPRNDQRDNS